MEAYFTGAGFVYYTVYSTKTSTAYCADLKLIVGHLQMLCVICVTYGQLLDMNRAGSPHVVCNTLTIELLWLGVAWQRPQHVLALRLRRSKTPVMHNFVFLIESSDCQPRGRALKAQRLAAIAPNPHANEAK